MKKLVSLLIVTLLSSYFVFGAEAQNYSDLNSHWGKEWVISLASKNIIKGYEDGTFKPDKEISRAEFLKIAMASVDQIPNKPGTFHWASKYVEMAYGLGIFTPLEFYNMPDYLDGPITRNEMAFVMIRINEKIQKEKALDDAEFEAIIPDYGEIPSEYSTYVKQLYAKGFAAGVDGGYYNGNTSASRAEACVLITRLIDPSKRLEVDFSNVEKKSYSKYGSFSFKSVEESFMGLENLQKIEKNTFPSLNSENQQLLMQYVYKLLDDDSIEFSNNHEKLYLFDGLASMSEGYQIGSLVSPEFTTYKEYEIKKALDGMSVYVSNSFGSESDTYKKVMNTVLDVLDGKIVEAVHIRGIEDGHLSKSVLVESNKEHKNMVKVEIYEALLEIDKIKSYAQVPAFEDQFTTFEAMDFTIDQLETDINKYPDVASEIDGNELFYNYYPTIHGMQISESGVPAMKLMKFDSGEIFFSIGFYDGGYREGARFTDLTNAQVRHLLNVASAYIYNYTSPEAHRQTMEFVFDYMDTVHLLPKDAVPGVELDPTYQNEYNSLKDKALDENYYISFSNLSYKPGNQFISITIMSK